MTPFDNPAYTYLLTSLMFVAFEQSWLLLSL